MIRNAAVSVLAGIVVFLGLAPSAAAHYDWAASEP